MTSEQHDGDERDRDGVSGSDATRERFPTDEPAVVTCGLPYANGDLHVGHLRTYVSGDALSRALRRLGQDTAFVSGSDMHGTPIAVNAAEAGVSPEEFARSYHEQYEEAFPRFNVEFDNYGHTDDETNTELTRDIVRTLDERGYVYEKEIKVAWDPENDQPLPDRFVEGTCPYCGERARGDECDEGCGRHLEPGEVEDPVSTISGNPAEYRDREHKFFRVSEFQQYLSNFLDRLEGTDNARNQPREWVEGELQDWCITRDMDWGIDYPDVDGGTDDLVLYVWVDAPIEYAASTKQYSERVGADTYDWESVWKDRAGALDAGPDAAPEGGEIIHIIGQDIIQHHTVFWPAMLRGAGYNEPRAVMACGFVNLAGQAFSTSRNRAVWADDYLDAGFHPDLFRYQIITGSEFTADVNFSWDALQERTNNDLVGALGNFLYRSLLFAHRNYGGIPDVAVSEDVDAEIEAAIDDVRAAVNEYSVRGLGKAPVALARFGNEYIQRHEPWKLVDESPAEAEQVIRDCVQLAKACAVLMQPVLPGKAETLWTQLGEDGSVHETTVEDAMAAPPAEFGEPTELFDRIEDETVETLNEQLEERAEAADDTSDESETEDEPDAGDEPVDLEPLADERISFDDFQALDVRVGVVESAEGIEGADDLARLEVDIGHETRQVVAGIKQLHDLDALPGKKVIVVANLEKAELFGVESNGMVLAAGEQADLLTTHGDAGPGTKIR